VGTQLNGNVVELSDPLFDITIEEMREHPKFRKVADYICFELLSEGVVHYKIAEDNLDDLLKEIFDDIQPEIEKKLQEYKDNISKNKIN